MGVEEMISLQSDTGSKVEKESGVGGSIGHGKG